jgi:hypothetical protein
VRTADFQTPVSPNPYKGFTASGRAGFIDAIHGRGKGIVLPSVEYVVRHAKAGYPVMLK